MAETAQEVIARRMRKQAEQCRFLGSPLYAELLDRAGDDAERGGVVWEICEGREREPGETALALRVMGAVHRIALEGRAPELAAFFPSCGGSTSASASASGSGDAWPALEAVLSSHADEVRAVLDVDPQTNEVGRAAALLGGFLAVAASTGLPLRILEIGASAGLLLRWDHYRYPAWGPAASPVQMTDAFTGEPPPGDAVVVERRGCDLHPIDAATDEGALRLQSFVWPDMLRRHKLLRAACEVAREVPVEIDQEPAGSWLQRQLAEPVEGVATVVYHSVFLQYLDRPERGDVRRMIREAGERAAPNAPVMWLSFEPARPQFEVQLNGRVVATAPPHGLPATWLG